MAVTTDMKLYNATQQLSDGVRDAVAALRSQSPAAETLLDALEAQVVQIASAFRSAEAKQVVGKGAVGKVGVVAFAKIRLRWEDARVSFADAVTNLVDGLQALMDTDEFQADPRAHEPDTPGLIAALAERLPQLDDIAGVVNDALDSSGDTGEKRAGLISAASKAVDGYRSKLAEFSELKEFESTEAGSYPSISLIEASLTELTAALADAVEMASTAEPERTAA